MDTSRNVVAYLTVEGGGDAIDFYEKAFGAKVAAKQLADDGKRVMHADLEINGGRIYLSDDFHTGTGGTSAPTALGGTGVTIHLETPEAEQLWANAVEAGATEIMPLKKQFWGALYGRLRDPFGHSWSIGGPAAG
jgi:PhnB protein